MLLFDLFDVRALVPIESGLRTCAARPSLPQLKRASPMFHFFDVVVGNAFKSLERCFHIYADLWLVSHVALCSVDKLDIR